MKNLVGKVAVISGASRGVGKGIALGLAEQGATVYVTGRTETDSSQMPEFFKGTTIHQTVKEVNALGGKGIAVRCDFANEKEIESLFEKIKKEQGRLDIVVNNAWAGANHIMQPYFWNTPFWQQPTELLDDFYQVGLRSNYLTSKYAAKIMTEQKSGLIVNISFYSASNYWLVVPHGLFKAATDKLTADTAHELKPYHVSVVSLYPGNVRTEGMMAMMEASNQTMENSESPQFVGRCISALAKDEEILTHSGKVMVTGDIASAYQITDIDGTIPKRLEMSL